jgi:hypothetical protein
VTDERKILSPKPSDSSTIESEERAPTEEEQRFARGLIGICQQVILKHQRMIDDIKRRYNLKSE